MSTFKFLQKWTEPFVYDCAGTPDAADSASQFEKRHLNDFKRVDIQEYLTYKKTHPPRILP